MRNLYELETTRTVLETFKKAKNDLTVREKGETYIRDYIRVSETRPLLVNNQEYLPAKKSVFNRIVGDSHFELEFAAFMESCPDVAAYAKNYKAVNFKLDYVNSLGNISNYIPDFFVKLNDGRVVLVETKGNPDLDTPKKIERLAQWCRDVNQVQDEIKFDIAYVEQVEFDDYKPRNFKEIIKNFTKYKE